MFSRLQDRSSCLDAGSTPYWDSDCDAGHPSNPDYYPHADTYADTHSVSHANARNDLVTVEDADTGQDGNSIG